ncbi:hypothetical protein BRAO375_740024 [Bradyrhizobium sp. ORS 375]|nr:hypothetical protein BRAO375_740024 [Bradyrhizobium sp. ORS 375]
MGARRFVCVVVACNILSGARRGTAVLAYDSSRPNEKSWRIGVSETARGRIVDCSFRVYHRDIDMRGLLHNGSYVAYFESAANDMLRRSGVLGFFKPTLGAFAWVVRRVELSFNRPLAIDDLLHVGVTVSRVGKSSLLFGGRIDRDGDSFAGDPSVSASIVWVYVDTAAQGAAPIPDEARAALLPLVSTS